jgi:putative phosphoesterase
MRIGVISDTHLNNITNELTNLVKSRFADCDFIAHASVFTDPKVYFYLQEVTEGNFIAVCGNMVPPELRSLLPARTVFEKLGTQIGLIHGWGSPHDLEMRIQGVFDDDDVSCIIYGHSHNGSNHLVENILFFNPGSPTDRHFAKTRSIGYLSMQDDDIIGEIVHL